MGEEPAVPARDCGFAALVAVFSPIASMKHFRTVFLVLDAIGLAAFSVIKCAWLWKWATASSL